MQVFDDVTTSATARVHNDDAIIDVQIDGERGDAVVLLAGFPLAREIWNEQAQALKKTHRVIRPDLRGMGASGVPAGPYLMETLAGDIAAVLDAMAIERAAIVGHSLGGYVALAFARMYVERLSHLALISSRIGADTPSVAAFRNELADRTESAGSIEPVGQWYRSRLTADGAAGDETVYARIGTIIGRTSPLGAAAMLRGMALRDSAEDIAGDLDCPVVVVGGRRDVLLPPDVLRAEAEAFPHAGVAVCERSGHVSMLEEPERLTGLLGELLRR